MRRLWTRHAARTAGLASWLAFVVLAGLLSTTAAAGAAPDPAVLSMSASVSPATLVAGSPAVYTVTVQNTGNAAATNVTTILPFDPAGTLTIGTPLPGTCTAAGQTVTCTEPTIPAAGSVTYQIPVTVLPSVGNGTNIALRGTATAAGVQGASTTLITSASVQSDVQITKTGPVTVPPGGAMTYTITVVNNGPSNAVSVTWHDPMDGNLVSINSYPCGNTGLTVTCNVGTMTPGQTQTYTIPVTVHPSVAPGTIITNCVTVYTGSPDTDPNNNQSCIHTGVATPMPPPVSNINIAKTGPATAQVGSVVTYSVSVTNTGPDPATNVVVTDPINVPFDSVSGLPAGCTLQASTVTCTAATLAVNATKTVSFNVKLSVSVLAGTPITNCASVSSQNDVINQNPTPACVQTTVIPLLTADVAIAKTAPAKAVEGSTATYTLTATNNGPDPADNVVVTDPTNTSLVTVSSAPGCTVSGGVVTCQVGALAVGSTRVFTITVLVSPTLPAGTTITNCGSISTTTADLDSSNNQSCDSTVVNPPVPVAEVDLTKTTPATAHAGDTITYTLTATNSGPDAATDVLLSDPLDQGLVSRPVLPAGCVLQGSTVVCTAGTLAVGQVKTFTFTVTIAPGLATGTPIDNCAQASSDTTILSPAPTPACAQTVIVPVPAADVAISKTGPATVLPNGTISYLLTATNHGPADAVNTVITDPTDPALVTVTSANGCTVAAGTVTCAVGTLGAGGTVAFRVNAVVNPGIQGLTIANCAQVATDTADPDTANNQSCLNTTVGTPPPVSNIGLTAHAPPTTTLGGTYGYSITVTNHGPDDASDVIISNPIARLVSATSLPSNCILNGTVLVCAMNTLRVGESKTLTFNVKVRSSTRVGAHITNCASATSTVGILHQTTGNPCVQTEVLSRGQANIAIVKTGPEFLRPGGLITYQLTATNHGPDAAFAAVIKDPTDPSLVTVTSAPGCSVSAGKVTCRVGRLAVGQTRRFTIEARANRSIGIDEAIRNCAEIYSLTIDPDLRDNQSCVDTLVVVKLPVASVTVVKRGPTAVRAGGTIHYAVTVTNHGPDTAVGVTVTDAVNQALVTVASLPSGCILRAGTITCRAGTLRAGQAKTFRFTVVAGRDLETGTLIDNCAVVRSRPGLATALSDPNAAPSGNLPALLEDFAVHRSCTHAKVVGPEPPPVPVTG
jgi:uncharacterized repeat protein (TIGR01451 family)